MIKLGWMLFLITSFIFSSQADFLYADRILYSGNTKIQHKSISGHFQQFLVFDTLMKGQKAPYDGIIFTPGEVQDYYSSEATTLNLKYKVKALQYQLDIQRQECERKFNILQHRYYWTVGGIIFGVSLTTLLMYIIRR